MSVASTTQRHPAAGLVRRAHDLVPDHPALAPLRARLLVAANGASVDVLRKLVRDLHRVRCGEAAMHVGHATLALALLPVPAQAAA